MLNLFERFLEKYIPRLIALDKIFLVTQTYTESQPSPDGRIKILVSDYEDKGLATIHKAAVKHDKYSSIIDLTNEKHLRTFVAMLKDDSPYLVFWAIVQDRERFKKRLDMKYKDNICRFIMKNTDWRIGVDESLTPQVQLIFGELFMILKRRGQELRVKFVDIEKS